MVRAVLGDDVAKREAGFSLLHAAFFAHHASASHLGLQLEAWPEEAVASDKLETGFIHTVTLSKTVTERLRNSDKCSEDETTESYLSCVGRWTKKLYRWGIKTFCNQIFTRFLSSNKQSRWLRR